MARMNVAGAGVRRTTLFSLVLFVLFLAVPAALHAQFAGSLRGTVTDSTGAVIPGAGIQLVNSQTNETMQTTSNSAGVYTFNALAPSTYTLTASMTGFKAKTIEAFTIIPEQANALNVTLEAGAATETVTVNANSVPLLDTDTATTSGTITSDQIQHLPSFNRDVFQLAQLAPGVFGDGAQSTTGTNVNPGNQGPGGPTHQQAGIFAIENGPQIQSLGGQYGSNGISVDGISTVSAVWGGTSVITPSEDTVDNVKVTSNGYDAESGRFSGAQIQVTSKSGSNQVHGSAFFKASRPGLNAYQRWNGSQEDGGTSDDPLVKGVNRDTTRTNNYGATLGGPIWKNRLFAFFGFETSPQSENNISQGWYETPQFDALTGVGVGPIATEYLTFPGEAPKNATLTNATCSTAGLIEGVNCVTLSGGLNVGSPIPTGIGNQDLTYGGSSNSPGVGGGLSNVPDIGYYSISSPNIISETQYNGRLDADATHRDHLSFAIYWVPSSSTFYNGTQRPANLWHHDVVNDAFTAIWNHTFSPTLLNQARANAAGWRFNELQTNPQAPFGLPQDNIDDEGSAAINFFGAPGPSVYDQWTYSYNDTLTKTLGNQNIKVGGEVTRLYFLDSALYVARPQFNFHNIWDFANDAPYYESGQFSTQTGEPSANRQDARMNLVGAFIQDDWKVRPNLTINAGMRWSYFGAYHTKQNNLDTVVLGQGADLLTNLYVKVGGGLQNSPISDFGPQLGFAWQPNVNNSKLVIRGGFGLNYNQNEIAIMSNGRGNPPNVFNANFTCAYPAFLTNPSCAGTNILYTTGTSPTTFFGYPPNPAATQPINSSNLPTAGGLGLVAYPQNPGNQQVEHYSLDAQYQLPYSSVFTLAYQGSVTHHALHHAELNDFAAQTGLAPNPLVQNLDYWSNDGTGNFNAMIATLRKEFSHSFQAEAMYTWSHALDNNSGPYSLDPYNYSSYASYGSSDYNVTNAFKLFGLYAPTFGHNPHGWVNELIGGWSLSGIYNAHSGFPWTPVYNTNGSVYYAGSIGSLRPATVVGHVINSTSNKPYQQTSNPNFPNPSAIFIPQTYNQGPAFPNLAPGPGPGMDRNSLNGPWYGDLDASLTKGFGIPPNRILGENAKFEFRADTYNLFNRTNIASNNIDANIASIYPDGSIQTPNPHFGVAYNALGARTVQLQARFSF